MNDRVVIMCGYICCHDSYVIITHGASPTKIISRARVVLYVRERKRSGRTYEFLVNY